LHAEYLGEEWLYVGPMAINDERYPLFENNEHRGREGEEGWKWGRRGGMGP